MPIFGYRLALRRHEAIALGWSPSSTSVGCRLFNITCTAGLLSGQTYQTTDPGRALITGQCADIGKVKVEGLRGLAARAPYFHNGSAATLTDVITHYEHIFQITPMFSKQQMTDLVNFLNAL